MAYVMGYFRSSWTLRADLVTDLACRIVEHMAQAGHDMVVPTVPVADADMPRLPWIDPENVNSGYIMRALHLPSPGRSSSLEARPGVRRGAGLVPAARPDEAALAYR